jgi:exo-1,4-beta-D-glucosaminidase
VHIAYDYFTGNAYVVNSTLAARTGMTATAAVYTIPDLTQRYSTQAALDVPANASTQALTIPTLTGLTPTYFIRLQLRDSTGAAVSNNVYWQSSSPDVLAGHSTWYKTAVKSYANLTGLNSLPSNLGVTATASRTISGDRQAVTITLRNPSTTNVAFFVRPEVTAGNGGNEVLPVDYSDGYVSLWPGESTTITASYATSDLGGQAPFLRVRGYNLPTFSIPVP